MKLDLTELKSAIRSPELVKLLEGVESSEEMINQNTTSFDQMGFSSVEPGAFSSDEVTDPEVLNQNPLLKDRKDGCDDHGCPHDPHHDAHKLANTMRGMISLAIGESKVLDEWDAITAKPEDVPNLANKRPRSVDTTKVPEWNQSLAQGIYGNSQKATQDAIERNKLKVTAYDARTGELTPEQKRDNGFLASNMEEAGEGSDIKAWRGQDYRDRKASGSNPYYNVVDKNGKGTCEPVYPEDHMSDKELQKRNDDFIKGANEMFPESVEEYKARVESTLTFQSIKEILEESKQKIDESLKVNQKYRIDGDESGRIYKFVGITDTNKCSFEVENPQTGEAEIDTLSKSERSKLIPIKDEPVAEQKPSSINLGLVRAESAIEDIAIAAGVITESDRAGPKKYVPDVRVSANEVLRELKGRYPDVIGFSVNKEIDKNQDPVFKISGPDKKVLEGLDLPKEFCVENVTLYQVPVDSCPGLTIGDIAYAPKALNDKYPLSY